jgi:hypothetical protein
MFDERAFIDQLEAADVEVFVDILAHPAPDQQRALRAYLGTQGYQRMHTLALRRSSRARRARAKPLGNVVVIPGLLGSRLTSIDRDGNAEHVWINPLSIANGLLERLRLNDDGRSGYIDGYTARPTGIFKRYYGEMLLLLSERWNVHAFWYDWRKDLDDAAAALSDQLQTWFGDEPAHIVAHGMGGLVARMFIRNDARRWRQMKDPGENVPDTTGKGRAEMTRGGRLIMLGTPNHGSFSIPQAIFGIDATLAKLELLDLRHDLEDIQAIFRSFVGPYQMLPSPFADRSAERFYEATTYGTIAIPPGRLKAARECHKDLRGVVDAAPEARRSFG